MLALVPDSARISTRVRTEAGWRKGGVRRVGCAFGSRSPPIAFYKAGADEVARRM
jgi:hypothetical protein